MPAFFTATIEKGPRGGAFVVIPKEIMESLGLRSRSKISATFDGVSYRGSLFTSEGKSIVGIRKEIRNLTGKNIGDEIAISIELDSTPRVAEVPTDLQDALDAVPDAAANFEALAFTYKKEFAKWITDAKKMETRERRLKKAIRMILDGQKL